MKNKETTSDGFHRIFKKTDYREFDFVSFKIGVEWKQERMYSELTDDIIDEWLDYRIDNVCDIPFGDWFKQFKNK